MKISKFNDSNVLLVTFGSGQEWKPAIRRLVRQVKQTRRFYGVVAFDERDLKGKISTSFLQQNVRGFGLWVWKPRIILSALDKFPECDFVVYLDAGCEVNSTPRALERLDEYVKICDISEGLAFEIPFQEKAWTSDFVLRELQAMNLSETNQIAGGMFLLKNIPKNRLFLEQWSSWMERENYRYLIGDAPDDLPKEVFKEHRFDQSIFSILWKLHAKPIIKDETFWAPDWKLRGGDFPIWSTRSRLGISFKTPQPFFFIYRAIRFFLLEISSGKIRI